MGTQIALNNGNLSESEGYYKRERLRLVVRMLLMTTVVVFSIETILMVFLEFILFLPEPVVVFVDGLVLATILFPLNYLFIVRPMADQLDERRRTNAALSKSNEILERFFSISDILIAYLDTDFNFIRVNQAYARTDERPVEDFVGKNHFELFPNEENRMIFQNVVKTGNPYYAVEKPFEYAGHPERGVTYWDWSLLPVKDPAGQVTALILVLSNVTSRKLAQLALSESERRFRGVFNQTFQHIGLLKPDGEIILGNQTTIDFSGIPLEVAAGKFLWELPWWDTQDGNIVGTLDRIKQAIQQASSGDVVRFEQTVRTPDSRQAILDVTIKPLLDDQGITSHLIYEARDITERIRSEQALRQSEQEVKRLYQAEKQAHQRAETLRNAILAFSGSLDSTIVLELLLDHLNQVVPYTSAHIYMLDDQEHLIVRLARGEQEWQPVDRLAGRRVDISDSSFYYPLLYERRHILVADTFLYDGLSFLPNDEFVRSWLAIPLQAGEQVIGICFLEHACPGFFDEEMVQWATVLTSQASVAIQNAWLFEQVRDGREHLQALSRQLVEAQESERHYIAQELHDEAGQTLTSLMIGLRHLERESSDNPAALARCQELKEITDNVMENLHRLAIHLRPAALDHLGLVPALRQHAENISLQHNLTVQFETVGKIERLSGDMETAIYRIVQETLTNIIRHANASRVDILLERRDDLLIVVVEDNGVGFDPVVPLVDQLGILGMRERADMLGGRLTIESSPGQGSSVILEVPCPSES